MANMYDKMLFGQVREQEKKCKAKYQAWDKTKAIKIKYVGAEVSATAEVKANSLELAAPALTVVEGIDLTNASYDTLAELVAYIDALPDWECELGDQFDGSEASASLAVVAAADVKTAAVWFAQDANPQMVITIPGEAVAALQVGDGSGHASGGAISSANLSTYQGGAPTGTQDMTYAGYLKWLYTFYPGSCTTILGNSDNIIEAITIAKPTTDPLWFYTFLNQGALSGKPMLVNGRAPATVRYVIHDTVSDNNLLGIDRTAALIAYREAGADLTETNKIINGQWNEIVISNTIGFQTLFASARKKLVTNA